MTRVCFSALSTETECMIILVVSIQSEDNYRLLIVSDKIYIQKKFQCDCPPKTPLGGVEHSAPLRASVIVPPCWSQSQDSSGWGRTQCPFKVPV